MATQKKEKMQTRAETHVQCRLPSELYEQVKARAKEEDRSVVSVIRRIFEKEFRKSAA